MKLECTYYQQKLCSSCDQINFDPEEQLKRKQTLVKNYFPSNYLFEDACTSPMQNFRDKAKITVSGTILNLSLGLEGEIDLTHCPLHSQKIQNILKALPEYIEEFKLHPYQINTRTGELKSIIIFISPKTNEGCIRFVMRSLETRERLMKLTPKLQKQFPELKVVSLNLQPIPHAILEGSEEIILSSSHHFEHSLNEFTFLVNPQAFIQTNTLAAEQLYDTARSWVKNLHIKNFIDLYCGFGPFSFHLKQIDNSGHGIEINPSSIHSANQLKEKLKMKDLTFETHDAQKIDSVPLDADLVVVNPPRAGLKASINFLLRDLPENILYSSCNIETLKIDFDQLKDNYKIKKVKIFDMFPHTKHFETLMLLGRLT